MPSEDRYIFSGLLSHFNLLFHYCILYYDFIIIMIGFFLLSTMQTLLKGKYRFFLKKIFSQIPFQLCISHVYFGWPRTVQLEQELTHKLAGYIFTKGNLETLFQEGNGQFMLISS